MFPWNYEGGMHRQPNPLWLDQGASSHFDPLGASRWLKIDESLRARLHCQTRPNIRVDSRAVQVRPSACCRTLSPFVPLRCSSSFWCKNEKPPLHPSAPSRLHDGAGIFIFPRVRGHMPNPKGTVHPFKSGSLVFFFCAPFLFSRTLYLYHSDAVIKLIV